MELYLDVFFTVNFMMDYLTLLLLEKMLKRKVSMGRRCFSAFLGSALTCFVVILPIPSMVLKYFLLYILVSLVMIITGLGIHRGRELAKAWIFLHIGGIFLGGVMELLQPYLRMGSLFFLLAVFSYLAVSVLWDLAVSQIRQNRNRIHIRLKKGERECEVEALVDTGNTLTDVWSGKPVSVLSKEIAGKLWKQGEEPFRYISYHSIGKEAGVMPLFELDGIWVEERRCWIEHPLAAVGEGNLSEDDYQMILNPDVFAGGVSYGN